jgi:8-oxo-dGTP diphosphatase
MHRFASVLLVDRRGWLLLQERDEHPVIDPERWGLVGGHVDPGEEFEAAAYRELEEETGIRLAPGELSLWLDTEVFHEAHGTLDAVQVWVARTTLTDADVVVGEGRQIVFVEPALARTLDLGASASRIVPEFLASETYDVLAG